MTTINFCIGKFDKLTHKQELSNEFILNAIHRTLKDYGVSGYTVISCKGCYTRDSGAIVREPSYKVTVCNMDLPVKQVCNELKLQLNREVILVEVYDSTLQCI